MLKKIFEAQRLREKQEYSGFFKHSEVWITKKGF